MGWADHAIVPGLAGHRELECDRIEETQSLRIEGMGAKEVLAGSNSKGSNRTAKPKRRVRGERE
jgi:hypothetical protein